MSATVLREYWTTKTRKAKLCVWCGRLINAGESAASQAVICDGEFYIAKLHPECHAANDAWFDPVGRQDEAPDTGEFGRGEVFNEPDTLKFTPEDCRLNPKYKAKQCHA